MAKLAHGATFSLGGTAVGELTNISLPDRTRAEHDTTDHDAGGDRTFVPGLRDGGTVTIEGRLAMGETGDTGQDALESNYAGGVAEEAIISLPDNAGASATTYTFDAFVTGINGSLPFDDLGSFSVTLKVSGAVTKAKAAAV